MSLCKICLTLTLVTSSIDVNFVASVNQSGKKIFQGIERISSVEPAEVKTFLQRDKNILLQDVTPLDKEVLKIETTSPVDRKSPTIRPLASKEVNNEIPGILEEESLKVETKNDFSVSHDSSLDLVINFIKQTRDEPTTSVYSNDDGENGNLNEVNLKHTALKLHEIIPGDNKTESASEQGRSHSITIASLVDKLLNQMGKMEILKGNFQATKPSIQNTSQKKESSEKATSNESEPPSSSLASSKTESSIALKIDEDDSSMNGTGSLSAHDDAFEKIVDKLMVIVNQFKESNATMNPNDTQQVLNSSSITNVLLEHLNKIFQHDKNVVSYEHKLVPVLKRPNNKLVIETAPPSEELKSIKDSRTELLPDKSIRDVDSDEGENFKETVFTYILDKLRERLSQRSPATQQPRENPPTETVVSNNNGKTTIFIYPQSKVKANQTTDNLKLDLFANTNNELSPFYTILNGQVIGSINLDSILKANSLKREQPTKMFHSSDVTEETVVEKPVARAEFKKQVAETPQFKKIRNSELIRNENVSSVSNDNKIGNFSEFIGFLKAIQDKLDNAKPKYELKSGGFDLSSLKVLSNTNQRSDVKPKPVQQIREFKDPSSPLNLDTSEQNRSRMKPSVFKRGADPKLSGPLEEDYDYSSDSEEFYSMRSSILARNEHQYSDYLNIDEETSLSAINQNNKTSGKGEANEFGNRFNKSNEDLSGILESISRRISIRPSEKMQKKKKRRKNKVNIRQGDDLSTANCECGRSSHPRIVGGQSSQISKHPWIAQLVIRNGNPFCGGTLINDRFILTAAHCLKGRKAEDLLVKMGSTTSNEGRSFNVKRLIPHEEYSPSRVTLYDIALVEIEDPLYEYSSAIKPICLPTTAVRSQDMRKGIIAGFGSLSENGQQSDSLQDARVVVMESSTCGQNYKYSQDQLNPQVLCAKEQNVDSCQGDSGGPLVRKIGNYHVQLGVTSWGIGCAREEYPGIYTKVSSYIPWIESSTYEAIYCKRSTSYNRQVVKQYSVNSSGSDEDYKIINEFIENIARQLRSRDKFISDDEVDGVRMSEAGASGFAPDSMKDLTVDDTFELIHG